MSKHVLGIEVRPQGLTLVQLMGTAKTYSVTAALHHALPSHAEPAERAEMQRQALQELVATHGLRADTVLTALPAHRAVLRNLTLPFKDPRRVYQILKGILEEHMPFEPEDVVADFQPLPSPHTDGTSLLVAAVPQEVIAEHLSMLQEVGLNPSVIDLDVFALANAALLGSATLKSNAMLIDLNPHHTLVTILNHGIPVFARSLNQRLPRADLSPESLANRLGKHLQHTLYACEHALPWSYQPDALLLSGEAGEDLGRLAAALESEIEIRTEVWRLTSGHCKPESMPFTTDDQTRFAVAFGAAVRGLHRQAVGVNLRREEFALHTGLEDIRGRLIGLGILLVCVIGLGGFDLYLGDYFKTQHHAQLQQDMARIFRATLPQIRMVQPMAQMREHMHQIEEQFRAFGGVTGAQLSSLQILREISAQIPQSLTVEVDTLTITSSTTDLSGTTASYDDVVKLKEALEASSFFASVKITNTKTDVQDMVAFKLTITTVKSLDSAS
ncbi:hypothetical protein NKDENANG_01354 [Candidatus Entotheonellaceae bacterium PAL068K]